MRSRSTLTFSPGAAGPVLAAAPGASWEDAAACAQADPALFFPEDGHADQAGEAKSVCRSCPVRAECLNHALTSGEEFGIWGGTTERERHRMKHRSALREAA